jgi:hypothetical protein
MGGKVIAGSGFLLLHLWCTWSGAGLVHWQDRSLVHLQYTQMSPQSKPYLHCNS